VRFMKQIDPRFSGLVTQCRSLAGIKSLYTFRYKQRNGLLLDLDLYISKNEIY